MINIYNKFKTDIIQLLLINLIKIHNKSKFNNTKYDLTRWI